MKDILRGIALVGIFTVPFVPLVVANSQFFPFITGKNFLFRFLVEIIFAAWILLALYDVKYRPRFSWLLVAFGAFVAIMAIADLQGVNPLKSFWSNFERMEGWVTLIHLFAYTFATAAILNTRALWTYFFNTMLAAASIMLMVTFAQIAGVLEINQGGVRVDGRLGNAAYNAIYMLFHAFIAALLFARTQNSKLRILYGVLAAAFVFILFKTATRGAILGLVGGMTLSALYIVIFGKQYKKIRQAGLGVLGVVVLLVGLFFVAKDTEYVKSHPIWSRVASISLEAGQTRFTIWNMAWNEGVKERPLLGWGQENFNYVFNQGYQPSMYAQEPWFDRVHNIFLDWLIAGGVLGFLGYFSVFFVALYYAVLRPMLGKNEEQFSIVEQGVILGLFAGYLVHNIFVFDNIVSYILYGSMLAFIHMRVSTEIPALTRQSLNPQIVTQVALPVIAVLLGVTVYFTNVPGYLASTDIIDGFRAPTVEARLEAFERALARNSFGSQEVREQLTRLAQQIARDTRIPQETRATVLARTEQELLKQVELLPKDARVRVFAGSFYRSMGLLDKALVQYEAARQLSPLKQQILFEIGLTQLQLNRRAESFETFKTAYELEPRFIDARMFYAMSAIYQGNDAVIEEIVTPEYEDEYAASDFTLRAAYDTKQFDLVTDLLSMRVEQNPEDIQLRVSLAVSQHENGDLAGAIATLEQAIVDFPAFAEQGNQYIADLRAGRVPK